MPHAFPQAPQFAGSAATSVHVPPQSISEPGQPHIPALHAVPAAHALPHVPQFALSVFVLTHAAPHIIRGVVHAPVSGGVAVSGRFESTLASTDESIRGMAESGTSMLGASGHPVMSETLARVSARNQLRIVLRLASSFSLSPAFCLS